MPMYIGHCMICDTGITHSECGLLSSCSDVFHFNCISNWIKVYDHCPKNTCAKPGKVVKLYLDVNEQSPSSWTEEKLDEQEEQVARLTRKLTVKKLELLVLRKRCQKYDERNQTTIEESREVLEEIHSYLYGGHQLD